MSVVEATASMVVCYSSWDRLRQPCSGHPGTSATLRPRDLCSHSFLLTVAESPGFAGHFLLTGGVPPDLLSQNP